MIPTKLTYVMIIFLINVIPLINLLDIITEDMICFCCQWKSFNSFYDANTQNIIRNCLNAYLSLYELEI